MFKSIQFILMLMLISINVFSQRNEEYHLTFPDSYPIMPVYESFGKRIAIRDNIAVIAYNAQGQFAGNAYVYEKQEEQWILLARLTAMAETHSQDVCDQIVIADSMIALKGDHSVFYFEQAEEGWKDMSETYHIEAYDYTYDTYIGDIKANEDVMIYPISVEEHYPGYSGKKKYDSGWDEVYCPFYMINYYEVCIDGSYTIGRTERILSVCSLDTDRAETPVFEQTFASDIKKLKVHKGISVLAFQNGDSLLLCQNSGDEWMEEVSFVKLHPQQEDYYSPTDMIHIENNMVSCVYKDPTGLPYLFCFEKSGDTWGDMNETAIIPLPGNLDLQNKYMIAHNENELLFSANYYGSENLKKVVSYSKTGDSWANGYTESEILSEDMPVLGHGDEMFGHLMAASGEYAVILDKGISQLGNTGRIGVYKDNEDGSLMKVAMLNYQGDDNLSFESIAFSGNTIVVSAKDSDRILVFEKEGDDWTDATETVVITSEMINASGNRSRFDRIRISDQHIILYDSNSSKLYSFSKPETGWAAIQNCQEIDINIEGDFYVYDDLLACVLNDHIALYNYQNEQWETSPFASLNYSDMLPENALHKQGKLLVKEDQVMLGICFDNDNQLDDNLVAGKILIYKKEGNTWDDQSAPHAIIIPEDESVNCGDFGKRYQAADDFVLVSYLSVDDESKNAENYNVIYGLNENMEVDRVARLIELEEHSIYAGQTLGLNSNRIIISQPMSHVMGENSGKVYSKHIADIDLKPVSVQEGDFSQFASSIYPNPIQDQFTITFESVQDRQINIYNIQGRLIDQFQAQGKEVVYNTASLNKGSYIIQLISDQQVEELKIVK